MIAAASPARGAKAAGIARRARLKCKVNRNHHEFFIEYYDLRHNYDPHQLHNLADKTSPEHLADLQSRLAAAWGCAGATCP